MYRRYHPARAGARIALTMRQAPAAKVASMVRVRRSAASPNRPFVDRAAVASVSGSAATSPQNGPSRELPDLSAPAERRSDMLQYRLDDMRVVVDPSLDWGSSAVACPPRRCARRRPVARPACRARPRSCGRRSPASAHRDSRSCPAPGFRGRNRRAPRPTRAGRCCG